MSTLRGRAGDEIGAPRVGERVISAKRLLAIVGDQGGACHSALLVFEAESIECFTVRGSIPE